MGATTICMHHTGLDSLDDDRQSVQRICVYARATADVAPTAAVDAIWTKPA